MRLFLVSNQYLSKRFMKERYFIELSYEGTNYHGWQIQPNSITVQEKLNHCLSTILSEEINVIGAGRTDTGVHAKQIFAHFDTESIVPYGLNLKMNSFLPYDISIKKVFRVPNDAHARFDAVSRTYEYLITVSKNPFLNKRAWHFFKSLDLKKMNDASNILSNHTDFTSFSKLHTQTKTNNCKISSAKWTKIDNIISFEITADRFLRNMVRAIVGTLIDVGVGKIDLEEFNNIIIQKNRTLAGTSVPAHGLYLTKVNYPSNLWE